MARTAAEIAEVGVGPPFRICRTLLCLVTLLKRARQAFTLEEPGITFEQAFDSIVAFSALATDFFNSIGQIPM